ncbi:DNA-directed primase/polymerase protein isoform X2 [Salmo salar]|uniref:DNA-directed primase/polymerase protein isoform X2 n=1 Tax=Salmo salar TaxID=8030 RepID=A0A1S3SJP4_SALSA|nr:DNA-directed primase/polymerase protein isoform X2 [Salmo salar]|eukprot:XP_014064565.1 PREDICTED: DNA-directed primase/polymerase protein-like isoform X2 [Salmo salar]
MNKGDWGNRLKKVEQLAQSFQQCPLSSRYKPRLSRLWQPSSIWKLFPRQCMAINFAQSCREVDLRGLVPEVSRPCLQELQIFQYTLVNTKMVTHYPRTSASATMDEEDQAYLMDDMGNIELS